MGSSLTPVGIFWACLSVISAVIACCGFYFPYWIQGILVGENETSFGCFFRCGYPRMTPSGDLEIVSDCGRYSSFWAIPSGWWRATTVIAGSGAMLSLLVGLTAAASCFVSDVLNSSSARFAGTLQFFSGLLIVIGVAFYPLGWGNKEVQDACGDQSGPYYLGPCKISWSMYLLAGGVFLLFLCFGLSFKACRVKKGTFRI
ncbi:unnamed protein product [Orchesella dallaii]|uniref:Uncharacterized protein n=1 Tax=Orchesella dallaii TaxID=48710 RepID=A0ABP1S8U6_9HEXA